MYVVLFSGMGSLVGFVIGGIDGAIVNIAWRVLNNADPIQVLMPPALAAVVTGIFKGWLVMGAVGFLLGLCVGGNIYQDLSQSYVRRPEAPIVSGFFQIFVSLAALIIAQLAAQFGA